MSVSQIMTNKWDSKEGIKDMVATRECLLSLVLGIIAHFTGHMVISGDDVIFIDLHQEEEEGGQ
jgi:hypothetical protein